MGRSLFSASSTLILSLLFNLGYGASSERSTTDPVVEPYNSTHPAYFTCHAVGPPGNKALDGNTSPEIFVADDCALAFGADSYFHGTLTLTPKLNSTAKSSCSSTPDVVISTDTIVRLGPTTGYPGNRSSYDTNDIYFSLKSNGTTDTSDNYRGSGTPSTFDWYFPPTVSQAVYLRSSIDGPQEMSAEEDDFFENLLWKNLTTALPTPANGSFGFAGNFRGKIRRDQLNAIDLSYLAKNSSLVSSTGEPACSSVIDFISRVVHTRQVELLGTVTDGNELSITFDVKDICPDCDYDNPNESYVGLGDLELVPDGSLNYTMVFSGKRIEQQDLEYDHAISTPTVSNNDTERVVFVRGNYTGKAGYDGNSFRSAVYTHTPSPSSASSSLSLSTSLVCIILSIACTLFVIII